MLRWTGLRGSDAVNLRWSEVHFDRHEIERVTQKRTKKVIVPNRFRDTFAVDMLARGASPYDVAKLLGDTIETVEKHYTPFVRELRERVRRLMGNGEGLESWAQFGHSDSQKAPAKSTTN